jgi:hypothetical protein
MQPAPAECSERKILEGRHRADLKVYLAAVKGLEHPLDTNSFNQTYQNAELAKRAFEKAREVLDAHTAMHGCSMLG